MLLAVSNPLLALFKDKERETLIEDLDGDVPSTYVVEIAKPFFYKTEDNQEISENLQSFFMKKLTDFKTHLLSAQERERIFNDLISTQQRKHQNSLVQNEKTQVTKLFENENNGTISENFAYREKIKEVEDQIEKLATIRMEEIDLPEELDITLKAGSSNSMFFSDDTNEINPLLPHLNDADLVIYSTISIRNNSYNMQFYAVQKGNDNILPIWENSTNLNNLQQDIVSLSETALPALILGRPWTRLKVNTDPQNTIVYLNNEVIGSGKIDFLGAPEGEYTLVIEALGYENTTQKIQLEAYQTTEIKTELQVRDIFAPIVLSTDPEGADVYQGSLWIGITPLEITKTETLTPYTLVLEGYRNRRIDIDENSNSELVVKLASNELTNQEIFENEKTQFYWSLGVLTLGLMSAFLLNEYHNELAMQFNQTQNAAVLAQFNSVTTPKTILYGVDIALGIYLGYRLVRYIIAAENLTK